jgi:hypothetical protein
VTKPMAFAFGDRILCCFHPIGTEL